ncbi:MAG: hypothetical protein PVF17_00835 [Ignavibacteria bacterium]|jgi:hypothetical protein
MKTKKLTEIQEAFYDGYDKGYAEGIKAEQYQKNISNIKLKPCPFCGADATIIYEMEEFQVVGCSKKSILCPNPSIIVYKNKEGEFDYKRWNKRS